MGCYKEAGVPPKKQTAVIGAITIIKINILAGKNMIYIYIYIIYRETEKKTF